MNEKSRADRRLSAELADVIANVTVRGFFDELITMIADLHEGVEVQSSSVDIRAEYDGKCICRIVPYRELIHLHIGASPVWEVRIRDLASYLHAVDHILRAFLSFVAEQRRPAVRYGAAAFRSR